MSEIASFEKDLNVKMIFVCSPILLFLFFVKQYEIALTFSLGFLVSWISFHFLAKDMLRFEFSLKSQGQAPTKQLVGSYFFRYLFLFVAFTVVFLYKLNPLVFAAGFFMFKVLLVMLSQLERISQK